eukprot:gene16703-18397_t
MDFNLEDLFAKSPAKVKLTDVASEDIVSKTSKKSFLQGELIPTETLQCPNRCIEESVKQLLPVGGSAKSTKEMDTVGDINLDDLFSEPPPKIKLIDRDFIAVNDTSERKETSITINTPAAVSIVHKDDVGIDIANRNNKKKNRPGNKATKYHSKCRISAQKMQTFIATNSNDDDDFFSEPVFRPRPMLQTNLLENGEASDGSNLFKNNDDIRMQNKRPMTGAPRVKNKKRKKCKKKNNQEEQKIKTNEISKQDESDDDDDDAIILPPRTEVNPHKWPVRAKQKIVATNPIEVKCNNELEIKNAANGVKQGARKQSYSVIDDILSQSTTLVSAKSTEIKTIKSSLSDVKSKVNATKLRMTKNRENDQSDKNGKIKDTETLLNLVCDAPLDLSVDCKLTDSSAKGRSKRGGKKKKGKRNMEKKTEISTKSKVHCKYYKDGKCRMENQKDVSCANITSLIVASWEINSMTRNDGKSQDIELAEDENKNINEEIKTEEIQFELLQLYQPINE